MSHPGDENPIQKSFQESSQPKKLDNQRPDIVNLFNFFLEGQDSKELDPKLIAQRYEIYKQSHKGKSHELVHYKSLCLYLIEQVRHYRLVAKDLINWRYFLTNCCTDSYLNIVLFVTGIVLNIDVTEASNAKFLQDFSCELKQYLIEWLNNPIDSKKLKSAIELFDPDFTNKHEFIDKAMELFFMDDESSRDIFRIHFLKFNDALKYNLNEAVAFLLKFNQDDLKQIKEAKLALKRIEDNYDHVETFEARVAEYGEIVKIIEHKTNLYTKLEDEDSKINMLSSINDDVDNFRLKKRKLNQEFNFTLRDLMKTNAILLEHRFRVRTAKSMSFVTISIGLLLNSLTEDQKKRNQIDAEFIANLTELSSEAIESIVEDLDEIIKQKSKVLDKIELVEKFKADFKGWHLIEKDCLNRLDRMSEESNNAPCRLTIPEKTKDDPYLKIVNKIYKDEVFKSKMKILCNFHDQFHSQLDHWYSSIQEYIVKNCLVKIDRLQVIVLATHGWLEFNKDTALVANEEFKGNFRDLPLSVKLFVRHLDVINESRGLFTSKESDYDYGAHYAKKQGFLFLNTCLSTNEDNLLNCLYSNEFVRKILVKSKKYGTKPIAILNLQMSSDYSEMIERFAQFEKYECCVQLDDPLYWDEDVEEADESDGENEELDKLKSLIEKGYEINYIYLKEKFLISKSIRKVQDPDNEQTPKDGDNLPNKDKRGESDKKNDRSSDRSADKSSDKQNQSPTEDKSNEKVLKQTEVKLEENQEKIQSVEALRILLTLAANEGWNVYKLNLTKLEQFCRELPNLYERFVGSNLYRKIDSQKQCFALLQYNTEKEKETEIENVLFFSKSNSVESDSCFDFLGIDINYDKRRGCYVLNQIFTIDQLIKEYETLNEGEIRANLLDLAAKTRPDLAATVNIPNQLSSYASQDLLYYLQEFKQFKLLLDPVRGHP